MDLSIIIPAYNAEEYICRCLDSVVNLDIKEYEIIVVDDGSTDGTSKRVVDYPSEHIRLVSKENGGLRSARISGLAEATGKYISFVDSDDWVDDGVYECFVSKLDECEKVDICCFDIVRNSEGGEFRSSISLGDECILDREDAIKHMVFEQLFSWSLCAKVYRKSVFLDELPSDRIDMAEDLDWNWEVFKRVNCVYYSPSFKYHYYLNQSSMTGKLDRSQLTKHIVFKRIIDDLDGIENEIRQYFIDRFVRELPMIMLEDYMMDQDISSIEINRKSFCEWFPRVSDKDTYDNHMISKLFSSTSDCIDYFESLIDAMKRDFSMITSGDYVTMVYGTGVISDFLNRWNSLFELDIDGYIVSDGQINKKEFRGKSVRYLSELEMDPERTYIVLALSKRIQELVIDNIRKKGYEHIYKLAIHPYDEL